MKALTLHQPWAMLVERGWKEVETRGWYTSYRGPLAIHAGLRWTEDQRDAALEIVLKLRRRSEEESPDSDWTKAVPDCLLQHGLKAKDSLGCIVAICELTECVPAWEIETNRSLLQAFEPQHGWETEYLMGNYAQGRYAWILRNVRQVVPYIPAKGNRRLWDWAPPGIPSIAAMARCQT